MAALLGIDVDRTISITFVIGAALAAVAGTMYLMYYGVVSFADGFVPGVKAFTAAVLGGIGSLPGAVLGGLLIGLIETILVGLFLDRLQGRRRLLDPGDHADLPAARPVRPAGRREGLTMADRRACAERVDRRSRRFKDAAVCRAARLRAVPAAGRLPAPITNIRNDLILATALAAAVGHRGRWSPSAGLLFALIAPWLRAARCSRRRAAIASGSRSRRQMVRRRSPSASSSPIRRLSSPSAGFGRRDQMDRQFRHPDPDLCDARLGPQYRRRPRRPARPRLCRLLRGRRLFLRAAGQDVRLFVLDSAAARRHPGRRSGAFCSAFRCCGCAATISPSSRSPSARSSGSC